MVYDPFSQIVESTPQTSTTITEYIPYTPHLIFGIDEKLVVGIVIGILILNFIQHITER